MAFLNANQYQYGSYQGNGHFDRHQGQRNHGGRMSGDGGGAGGGGPGRILPSEFGNNGEDDKQRVLYIGNLAREVTEDLILQLFGAIGTCLNCKLISEHLGNDPYCFVEFENHIAAKSAMDALNGRSIFNKPIKVNWATTPSSKKDNLFNIFVGDLDQDITTEELRSAFNQHGNVVEARVVRDAESNRSKGYGFVGFATKLEAETAMTMMNNKLLGTKCIRTNWAARKMQPQTKPEVLKKNYDEVLMQATATNCTVYVGSLIKEITDTTLRSYFETYGTIQEVRVFPDKGYGFVKMDTHENAAAAITNLHGTNILGTQIKCNWGKETPTDPSAMYAVPQQQQQYSNYYAAAYPQQQQQQYVANQYFYQAQPYQSGASPANMQYMPPNYQSAAAAALQGQSYGGGMPAPGNFGSGAGMMGQGNMMNPNGQFM
ncbi:nucleolysin TIAR-like isoform X2 [Antedon mediterranea]|uniref:nucleolysin TIAR-like isoform X2 n=1 Tax=Antedon mediterranea TaxID=105859 RepID=UPI003AF8548E